MENPVETNEKQPVMLQASSLARSAFWVLVVIALTAVVTAGVVYWMVLRSKTPKLVLGVQESALVNEANGESVGTARKIQEDGLWRVSTTVKLDEIDDSSAYHGWMVDPLTERIQYAGEMFLAPDGYSLTFSTEQDLIYFSQFRVSRERAGEIPTYPANNIVQWSFIEQ